MEIPVIGIEETIKVAFVGTSCAGKSTLLDVCKQRLSLPSQFVPEAAREYFTQHPEVTDRFSVEAQGEVQALALHKEQQAHLVAAHSPDTPSVIVCDRSVLDAPVYVASQGNERGARTLLDRVSGWLITYDKIYLLDPRDVPYVTDNIRTESSAVRGSFHKAFVSFFEKHAVDYELLSGTTDERYERVDDFIADAAAQL